jgi:hypothetical protein
MEESVGSLHFAHDTPTPNSEGSIDIVGQERREDDLGIERLGVNDIELVAR